MQKQTIEWIFADAKEKRAMAGRPIKRTFMRSQ